MSVYPFVEPKFTAASTVQHNRRLKLEAGAATVSHADSAETEFADTTTIYVSDDRDYGSGEVVPLGLHGDVRIGTSNGAITVGDMVYAADDGKIAASGTVELGTALDTVASGEYCRYFRPYGGMVTIEGQTGAVTTIFGRDGDVIATVSDYDASQVDNDSGVTGTYVSDALDWLLANKSASTHTHNALEVVNDSGVTGANVDAALETLDAAIVTLTADTRFPTQDENDALAGTGTPSASNVFVTADTLAAGGRFLGAVATKTLLDAETSDNELDRRWVAESQLEYYWSGSAWVLVSGISYGATLPSVPITEQLHWLTGVGNRRFYVYNGTSWE